MTDLAALSARLRAGTVTPADLDAAADALSDGSFYQEKDIDAMQARIAALEAENARLRTPDLFWDDDGYGFEDWKDLLDQSFDLDHVAKVLCGRSLPIKWAANECVSLDDDGDPDEIVPRLFDTPAEAARCWPDSLNRLRAALPQPPEADNG